MKTASEKASQGQTASYSQTKSKPGQSQLQDRCLQIRRGFGWGTEVASIEQFTRLGTHGVSMRKQSADEGCDPDADTHLVVNTCSLYF